MKSKLLIIGLAALLAAGCASVPMTDTAQDFKAKKFVPEPDKASIYVNRGGGVGTALTLPMVLDGRIVGALAPHTYQLLSVPAGEHVLATAGTTENVAQFKFITDQGKNYFFNVGFSMGWAAPRVHLDVMQEQEGQAAVKSSKRAEATTF